MKLDKDSRKLSRQLYQASFTDGRIDGSKVAIIGRKIAADKPRNALGILKEYQRLVRLEVESHHAVIESASALDQAATNELLASLRSKYGNDMTTEFKVTPELLGGLRIQIGSDVFDSSIRERLNRLDNQLAQA